MKKLILTIVLLANAIVSFSQAADSLGVDTSTYKIIKTDGGELIGKILS